MPFFKPSTTTKDGLARLETLVWVFVYGGLLTLLLGVFIGRQQAGSGRGLMVVGVIVFLVGVVLIYVRSRLSEKQALKK